MAKKGAIVRYNPNIHPIIVKALAEEGKTDPEISSALGICRDTFWRWRKRYPELQGATTDGKDKANKVVENSLYNRANGMTLTDKKIIKNPDGSIRQEITTKEIPPDTIAGIFWLKNRDSSRWRDKQEVEHSGEAEQSVIILPSNGRQMREIPDTTAKPNGVTDGS